MQGQSADDILGSKKMNYEFLLLVRDKKYVQALTLGRKILSMNADNPSVQKFCKFIEKNNSEILKMVQRQKQQEQYESMDDQDEQQEEQEQGEEVQGQQGENEDNQKSQDEDNQEEDQMEEQEEEQQVVEEGKQKREKIQLTTCTLNQIPHICPRHHKVQESPSV